MAIVHTSSRSRAFTLIELLVVVAIIAILVGILLPALAEAKRSGKLATCQSNQHQFGLAMQNYATDFKELLYTFTWKQGVAYTDSNWPYGPAGTELQAARDQATYILRLRGANSNMVRITENWFPHALYGHLILNDYLQQRLPEKMVVCPEDKIRLNWQLFTDETQFAQLPPSDRPNPVTPDQAKRLPYSSTYMQMPCEWSSDLPTSGSYVYQPSGSPHSQFTFVGNNVIVPRRLSDVTFASQKVYLGDEFARHTGKVAQFYAYPDSKSPIAFFDGSVRVVSTNRTNYGFTPADPTNYAYPAGVTQILYSPAPYEPSARNAGGDLVTAYYRWTRAGLRGIDFNGKEVSSGGNPPPGGSGGT